MCGNAGTRQQQRALALVAGQRGDLLHKLGRHEEASDAFERAAAMTRNERERELLSARARASAQAGADAGG